jgi:enamine deaminase RidA (YjgF/YER057c/UK114 family)
VQRRRISSGSSFEAEIGYSRALVVPDAGGDWIFVSGTTGFDYAAMKLADGVVAQCETALANIAKALADAGSSLDDTVRVRYILPDGNDFQACWPALRAAFGKALPAATMIIAQLMDPAMKIEIEVTARKLAG